MSSVLVRQLTVGVLEGRCLCLCVCIGIRLGSSTHCAYARERLSRSSLTVWDSFRFDDTLWICSGVDIYAFADGSEIFRVRQLTVNMLEGRCLGLRRWKGAGMSRHFVKTLWICSGPIYRPSQMDKGSMPMRLQMLKVDLANDVYAFTGGSKFVRIASSLKIFSATDIQAFVDISKLLRVRQLTLGMLGADVRVFADG